MYLHLYIESSEDFPYETVGDAAVAGWESKHEGDSFALHEVPAQSALRSRVANGGPGRPVALTLIRRSPQVQLDLETISEDHDLVVYIADNVSDMLPQTMTDVVEHANSLGIPIILVALSAGLRRGDARNLGFESAYEIFPERAFLTEEQRTPVPVDEMAQRISKEFARIATTWAW